MKLVYSPQQRTSHIYASLDDKLIIELFDDTIDNGWRGVIVS